MATGWQRLGDMLGGGGARGEDAYTKRLGDLLTLGSGDQKLRRMVMENEALDTGLGDSLAGFGYTPEQARAATMAARAGIDPRQFTGARGDLQEQGFRQSAVEAARLGDWATGNANMLGIANGPVDLAKVQGDTLLGNVLVPGGDSRGPTEVGRGRISADQALAQKRLMPEPAGGGGTRMTPEQIDARMAFIISDAERQAATKGQQWAKAWARDQAAKLGVQIDDFGDFGGLGDQVAANASAGSKKSGDESKAEFANAGLAQDAMAFAGAFLQKSPAEIAKMKPEEIRDAIKKGGGRLMTGPGMRFVPYGDTFFTADLEAYSNSAAGKQARLNNPTGPVSNADFEVARRSVFSADKPASVNADLVYQALTRSKPGTGPAAAATGKYRVGQVIESNGKRYRVTGGDMNDPDVEEVR